MDVIPHSYDQRKATRRLCGCEKKRRIVVYRVRFHFSLLPLFCLPFDLFYIDFFVTGLCVCVLLLLGRSQLKSKDLRESDPWAAGRLARHPSITGSRAGSTRRPEIAPLWFSFFFFSSLLLLFLLPIRHPGMIFFSFIQNAACNDNTTFFHSRGQFIRFRRHVRIERKRWWRFVGGESEGDWRVGESVREFKARWVGDGDCRYTKKKDIKIWRATKRDAKNGHIGQPVRPPERGQPRRRRRRFDRPW